MDKTTIIYLEKNNQYLMLHRNKKENDLNKDKWIGVGGHVEENETIDECIIREVKEETNLELLDFRLCGEVTFDIDGYLEIMYVYTSTSFKGEIKECNEGTLEWVDKDKINLLNIWEGDKIIFEKMISNKYFKLNMIYLNDKLISYNEYN